MSDPDISKADGNFANFNHFSDIGLDAIESSIQTNFTAIGNQFSLKSEQRTLVKSGDYPAAIYMQNVKTAVTTLSTER